MEAQKENIILFSEFEKIDTLENKLNNGFSEVDIKEFKQFNSLKITKLNRINIFAGKNNSGKTSVLELFYLVAKFNDLKAFFEIQRKRGRFQSLPTEYVRNEFNSTYEISGIFNNKEFLYKTINYKEANDNINATKYLYSILNKSVFAGERFDYKANINKDSSEFWSQKVNWLCKAAFSTPFSSLSLTGLEFFHEESKRLGVYPKLITFIQKYIDPEIQEIEFVGYSKRFLVTHQKFEKPVDLTRFGTGLLQIYFISLQLAASTNGVLCVDEIDNAIHHSLFVKFTEFISKLSENLNVQLFISSHNDEFIGAFFKEEIDISKISAYRLEKENNDIKIKYVSGEKYNILRNSFNQDLRG